MIIRKKNTDKNKHFFLMKIYSNNIPTTDFSNLTSGFQLISFDFQIHAQKDPQFTRALQ
jgi:hypothetical protein